MMDNYEPESVMGSTFHKLNKQHDAANAWVHGIQMNLQLKILRLALLNEERSDDHFRIRLGD